MRLLGNFKIEDKQDIGGSFNIFFVKPGRLFIKSYKFNYFSSSFNVHMILEFKKDKWIILDTYTQYHSSDGFKKTPAIIKFITDTLAKEDVKKQYDDLTEKYIPQLVRPVVSCSYFQNGYSPSAQSLGIEGAARSLQFYTCREQFAGVFVKATDSIFFCTSDDNRNGKKDYIGCRLRSRRVGRFIRRIEKLLKLKTTSVFYETNNYTVLEVMPASIWKKSSLNRSLFTILLRAGLLYDSDKDNYEEALKGYNYSKQTLPFILRFIHGYTQFTGAEKNGWLNTFANLSTDPKKALVKP